MSVIDDLLSVLTDAQRQTIEMRFGLDGEEPMSQERVAAVRGISQQAVAQAESAALTKMRAAVGSVDPSVLADFLAGQPTLVGAAEFDSDSMVVETERLTCKICFVSLPATEFESYSNGRPRARCRECRRDESRERTQSGAGREALRRWYAKPENKLKQAGHAAAWRAARRRRDPEGLRAADREANRSRRARLKETDPVRLYLEDREREQRRRARAVGNGVFKIAKKDERRLRAQPCQHDHRGGCSGQMNLDHIVPLSRGGRHSIGNLQMLCQFHNTSKNNRLEVEVRAGKRRPRKTRFAKEEA